MNKIYMLDTNICSFIMREQPEAVLKHLEQAVLRGHRIVVSAITYAEMRFGATGPKASPRHVHLVDAFCARLDAILPWDRAAVGAPPGVQVALRGAGIRVAVNSNKPDAATKLLCAAHYGDAVELALGERPDIPKKPAPVTACTASAFLLP